MGGYWGGGDWSGRRLVGRILVGRPLVREANFLRRLLVGGYYWEAIGGGYWGEGIFRNSSLNNCDYSKTIAHSTLLKIQVQSTILFSRNLYSSIFYKNPIPTMNSMKLAVVLVLVVFAVGVSVEGRKWEDGAWVYDDNAACSNSKDLGTTNCYPAWKDTVAACTETCHAQSQFQGYIKRDGCTFSKRFCCSTGSF
ncbi:hypothetical protein Fcan01_20001 [Folsomia candida]|uniref:Uncharacterized protein n=1 Tax=Folsomia candida TaxID=158441 RepID=A0A226DL19_FOLCA|nr:hypothetical protein Fcan01_20001 [Folsomia candida]